MRLSTILSLSATFLVASASPASRSTATADFTISRINIVNNSGQNFIRFLQGFVEPGHENEPVPTFSWRQLASLDAGQSQSLELPGSGLCRFAINGRIPAVGSSDYPLFEISSSSTCTATFKAESPHFSVQC